MMKRRAAIVVAVILGAVAIGWGASAQVQTASANALIAAMKRSGAAIHDFDATITIETYKDGAVSLTQEVRLLLRQPDAMRLEYLSPAYLAGNVTLIVGTQMDVYIAAVDRWYRKDLATLNSAEQPWLLLRNILTGVHDLLSDYTFTLARETRAGATVDHLDGVPNGPDATYGRIELWVDAQTLVPVERKLYDVNGNLLADTRFSEITQVVSGIYLPLKMDTYDPDGALVNEITYTAATVNRGLDPDLFVPPSGDGQGSGTEGGNG